MTVEPISSNIRRATASDAAEIASLGGSVFFESFAHSMPAQDMDDYLKTSYSTQRIESEIQDHQSHLFYVARDDITKELLGFVQLNRSSQEPCLKIKPPNTIELQRIYTHSKAQGRGVGSQLMGKALSYAVEQGYKAIWLGVWEDNLKAQKFYLQTHGFEKVGHHDFTMGSCVQTDWILERFL
ncbi:hypothetical protein EX895_002798 [Sporisorium graminicola]|uniref:N-acetyltransferase domain-containing protein n=1 Tax=Sporisorium graminicola TaxID=280036 RepID=A0A4U7KW64_9BASI|nr:hypothetical protein EX895_002798 [Sporisorium graminicola]TKY88446.1 hypothetical protein EX895_002798 [Sporisorium graminicola]